MSLTVLAVATEIVLLAAGIAVLLLLVFQLRLQQRYRILDLEVERLKKAHRDGTLDARSRLEEASNALEALEETVAPRLKALDPHLADVGSRLDELEEEVAKVTPVVEAAAVVQGFGERFGELEEAIREARSRVQEAEGGLDHLRETVDRRLDEIQGEVATLEGTVLPGKVTPGKVTPGAARAPETETETAAVPDAATRNAVPGRGLGLRGALVVVLALAGVFLVLRWLLFPGG